MKKTSLAALIFVFCLLLGQSPTSAQDPGIPDTIRFLPWGIYVPHFFAAKAVLPMVVVNDESLRVMAIALDWTGPLRLEDVIFADERSEFMDQKYLENYSNALIFVGEVSPGKPSIPPGNGILFYLHFWPQDTGTVSVHVITDLFYFRDNSGHNFVPFCSGFESRILLHSAFPGDADFDGQTTISDVVWLINYLYRGGPAPVWPPSGDVNTDGKTTVSDVIYFINYLFRDGPCLGGVCYN